MGKYVSDETRPFKSKYLAVLSESSLYFLGCVQTINCAESTSGIDTSDDKVAPSCSEAVFSHVLTALRAGYCDILSNSERGNVKN